MPDATPTEIEKLENKGLRIKWSDGHEAIYPFVDLRDACQCASCVEEWSGKKVVIRANISPDITPRSITPTGRYAITIQWSDGHDTGIYAFDLLRSLCPCEVCKDGRKKAEKSA